MFSKQPRYYYDADAIREPCSADSIVDFQRRKTLTHKNKGQGTYGEVRPDLFRSWDAYMPQYGTKFVENLEHDITWISQQQRVILFVTSTICENLRNS
ncbi:MAG: hypothetical protein FWC74_05225 [Candidatus Bathyarchaeota archaeon]|nr:hypothetical protein [Candidatus Termitimicrobium sp.]